MSRCLDHLHTPVSGVSKPAEGKGSRAALRRAGRRFCASRGVSGQRCPAPCEPPAGLRTQREQRTNLVAVLPKGSRGRRKDPQRSTAQSQGFTVDFSASPSRATAARPNRPRARMCIPNGDQAEGEHQGGSDSAPAGGTSTSLRFRSASCPQAAGLLKGHSTGPLAQAGRGCWCFHPTRSAVVNLQHVVLLCLARGDAEAPAGREFCVGLCPCAPLDTDAGGNCHVTGSFWHTLSRVLSGKTGTKPLPPCSGGCTVLLRVTRGSAVQRAQRQGGILK